MESKKILFVTQEMTPYLPESEISVISRYLPQGVQEKGREIRAFMPQFGCINSRRNQLHEVIRLSGMNLIIDDTDHPLLIKVASIQAARMQVYFIDNDDYFQRKCTLSDENGYFEDNDERAIFFARGVIETVRKLRWAPDIVHCHGWFTGLVPLYLKKSYNHDPLFENTKIVYSLYKEEFNKPLHPRFHEKALFEGVVESDLEITKNPTFENFNKMILNYSDGAIIGSSTINGELDSFLKTWEKPVLGYQSPDTYIDAFNTFYDQILNTND